MEGRSYFLADIPAPLYVEQGPWIQYFIGQERKTIFLPIVYIINVFQRNTLLIVTRYFGGTLLGTGGLVRAYSTAAKDALGHAEAAVVRPVKKAGISCAYPDLARVDKLLSGSDGVFCGRRSYGETAEITLYLLADQAERFAMSLADATAGRVRLQMTDDAEILTLADRFHSEY